MHKGHKQYANWKKDLIKNSTVTDIFVGEGFYCSSSDVVNSVLDDIGRLIASQGLYSLEFNKLYDKNRLMQWPFSQFVAHSKNLTSLKIIDLWPIDENLCLIMDFCGEVSTTSKSLKTLHFEVTRSSKSSGEKLWTTLANHDALLTLTNITIELEKNWFKDDSEECMEPLLIVLARQSNLAILYMEYNGLSRSQAERIRDSALSANA